MVFSYFKAMFPNSCSSIRNGYYTFLPYRRNFYFYYFEGNLLAVALVVYIYIYTRNIINTFIDRKHFCIFPTRVCDGKSNKFSLYILFIIYFYFFMFYIYIYKCLFSFPVDIYNSHRSRPPYLRPAKCLWTQLSASSRRQ